MSQLNIFKESKNINFYFLYILNKLHVLKIMYIFMVEFNHKV